MKEKMLNEGYIVNDASGMDWSYHRGSKDVKVAGKDEVVSKLEEKLPEGTEYMIVANRKDDKEYEFSIILQENDKYYFVTDSPGTIKE